jgi:exodeoxyribonuclease V alpha subunit
MTDKLSHIRKLAQQGLIDYSHYTLARFLNENFSEASELCLWLAILVNQEVYKGNVCLPLKEIAGSATELGWDDLPQHKQLIQAIANCPLIGGLKENKPLVFDDDRLYLNRMYHHEKDIANFLIGLSAQQGSFESAMRQVVSELFNRSEPLDLQKLSAIVACTRQLCVISGGPGTGKTWTVSRILALLLMQQNDVVIQLAAPTGKAAARLSQSMNALQSNTGLPANIQQRMPTKALTLHRLLGIHRFTHRPSYDQEHPLNCDVLVLDEASMIDQQLMALICEALPGNCCLILLGDKDQLSSVEAGSVFADLCGDLMQTSFTPGQQIYFSQTWNMEIPRYSGKHALADNLIVLQKSHRFDDASGIGKLARLTREGNSEACIELLRQSMDVSVQWKSIREQQITQELLHVVEQHAGSIVFADHIEQAFEKFHQNQILCAVWQGPAGVNSVNDTLDKWVMDKKGVEAEVEYYAGKPLMMTANAYQLNIHNGDIGIVWPDAEGKLKVWFEQGENGLRALSLSQCPAHVTAYAMTVHKSQGSEFTHVMMLLPQNDNPVLTRELFYTGISRASETVEIWGSEDIIRQTLARKTVRHSGLMERLKLKH